MLYELIFRHCQIVLGEPIHPTGQQMMANPFLLLTATSMLGDPHSDTMNILKRYWRVFDSCHIPQNPFVVGEHANFVLVK